MRTNRTGTKALSGQSRADERTRAKALSGQSRADVSDGNEGFVGSKPCGRADGNEGFVGSIYIYIVYFGSISGQYIYIYCIFWQHFFVNANFIKHNRHFLTTYFLLDPFVFPYYFYRIRRELIYELSIVVCIPSTFCPTLGHHQEKIFYKSDVTFVSA